MNKFKNEYERRKSLYGKRINTWRMNSWKRQALKDPLRHKARRIKMSLTTMKIERPWTLEECYEKVCRPVICPYCEITIPFQNISLDHKIAKSDGGLNDITNIQLVCLRCNMLKGKLNDAEFRRLIFIVKQYPDLMLIYEKRIAPSLKYWQRCINKSIVSK